MPGKNAATFFLCLLLFGCAGGSGIRWGETATVAPGWDRMGRAAAHAALSPLTWVPAAGAGLMQVGAWDRDVSKWATRRTPVFGSGGQADRFSNYLLAANAGLYGITVVSVPGGGTPDQWLRNKGKGGLVDVGAVGVAAAIAGGLKSTADRTRPDFSDTKSFPSGHAVMAASMATISENAIRYSSLPKAAKTAAETGYWTIATGTAWSRVEAGKHYPSDVLAGMALGHFFSAFITESFLGQPPEGVVAAVEPFRGGFAITAAWTFP